MPKKRRKLRHPLDQVVILDRLKTGGFTVKCSICGEIDFADFSADPDEAFRRAEIEYLSGRQN